MPNIRSFICITFPREIVKEIARIQDIILKTRFKGSLTSPENLHLTLKFLGEIQLEKLEKVKSLLSNVEFKSFEARLQYIGTFSHKKQPRIAWMKISSKLLFDLQKTIDDALSPLFPKEKRFMSHLTLARIKHVNSPPDFINYIKQFNPKKSVKLKRASPFKSLLL